MNNPVLVKNFTAESAAAPYRIMKFGAAEGKVKQTAAATDSMLGVSTMVSAEAGERIDVILSGVAEVEYGGTVAAGDYLTSNANGQAVKAAPAAGVNNGVIGKAVISGASGDVGSVLLVQTQIQG
jgi:hypothetical protein